MNKILLILSFSLLVAGCGSTSEFWIEKRVINGQEVSVSVIKHQGNIKAEHPSGAKGENSPLITMPTLPSIKYE